jgi:predicted  nucleic acid-binding Zn ribbon protein
MIVPSINITPCKLTFTGDCDKHYIEFLIDSWVKPEQVLSDGYFIDESAASVRTVYLNLSSPDALNENWNGFYANKWMNFIKAAGVTLHIELQNTKLVNKTRKINYLIFGFTRSYFALRSGDDFEGVPLFYLGFKEESEFCNQIRSLICTFESLDYLETNIRKFNKSIVKELYHLNSETNQKGIRLANEIENRIGIPTYYFLNRYTYSSTVLKELNRDLGDTSNTYLCLENENFQLINPKQRIVSNITNQLLDKSIEYANKHPLNVKRWNGQH